MQVLSGDYLNKYLKKYIDIYAFKVITIQVSCYRLQICLRFHLITDKWTWMMTISLFLIKNVRWFTLVTRASNKHFVFKYLCGNKKYISSKCILIIEYVLLASLYKLYIFSLSSASKRKSRLEIYLIYKFL